MRRFILVGVLSVLLRVSVCMLLLCVDLSCSKFFINPVLLFVVGCFAAMGAFAREKKEKNVASF